MVQAGDSAVVPLAVCLACVAGLLWAERHGERAGIWLFKPMAATCYVWAAWRWGALASTYGRWVLLALALCWWGDVLLIPRQSRPCFRAGVLAFLVGHLVYITAFLHLPIGLRGLAFGIPVAGGLIWIVWRWLGPWLAADDRTLVAVYVLVICCMLLAASAAAAGSERWGIAFGALMFAVSDLSVARERFVVSTFFNRMWGLPLYFAAQWLLASTVRFGA